MLSKVYLMNSVPYLSFGQLPPIELEEFMSMAKSQLSGKSYKTLEQVSLQYMENNNKKRKLKSVSALLDDMLKDLSEIRMARAQNRQPRPEQLPGLLLEANPLEREKQIMRWQWEKLEDIQAGKTFTFYEVFVYKLKLELLWRLSSFSVEQGQQVFESVVNPAKMKGD